MSKKKSFWENPFGTLFDFNHDGRTSGVELWMAEQLYEKWKKGRENGSDYDSDLDYNTNYNSALDYDSDLFDEDDSDDYYTSNLLDKNNDFDEDDDSDEYEWREFCEDGTEYDIDPEDYETEEEYEEALDEARYGWRDTCEDGIEYGIDPEDYETEEEYEEMLAQMQEETDDTDDTGITLNISIDRSALDRLEEIREEDYPNTRRYQAAYVLANPFAIYFDEESKKKDQARCRFILEKSDTVLAAEYLSYASGFLYAQAIKDNFSLPCSLPDEDETREMEFWDILCKIAKRDIPLSFKVWSWCMEQFLPYAEYDDYCGRDLSERVIDSLYLYEYPDGYREKLIHYMNDNEDFCDSIMAAGSEQINCMKTLIVGALKEELYKVADILFESELKKACNDWKAVNSLISKIIWLLKDYKELESMEYLRDKFLPLVKAIPSGMVQDEVPEWEKDIAEYIEDVEDRCKKYTYTRKNAWRKTVPDGKEYGLDPVRYNSEQEYMEALKTRIQEANRREQSKRMEESKIAKREKIQEYEKDTTIYRYCGVLLPFLSHSYSYRTEDSTIEVGDTVIVPVGMDEKETEGKVVSVGQYSRLGVPYPVEKTKMIIRKVAENEE